MAISVGQRGFVDLVGVESGPERSVRVVSFMGRSDTGFIPAQFNVSRPPIVVINVETGLNETGHFIGTVTGGISQDTGAGDKAGTTFFAIVTDTGVATLP
jgi:hypothetical protein